MEREVPKTLDWVKARHGCSLTHAFGLLREMVKTDINSASEHLESQVTLEDLGNKKFTVTRRWTDGSTVKFSTVVFDLDRTEIHVAKSGAEAVMFSAKPAIPVFNDRCLLEVDGEPLEYWQVSRKALEDLFFPK